MAINTVNSAGIADGSIVNADIKSDAAIAKTKLAALNIGASDITDEAITLAKLEHGDGTSDGKFLRSNNGADPTWVAITSTPEGTAIKSTGESGGTKFLREDGDNSCSWQSVPAGTPTGGNSGANKIFWENEQTVTHDYTITDARNAGTWGPVTINSGVTVTIGDGEYWTIM